MKRFVVVAIAAAFAVSALAAEPTRSGAGDDPMHGWVPRKVKNEAADRKEIQAVFKAMEDAGKTGNLDAAAALVDFPVLMVTDDSQGQATGSTWTREKWTEVMKPFYAKPNPDMKVTHKPTVHVLTDSLASVYDEFTMKTGTQSYGGRSTMLLVRRDGKWLVKSMMEGGWGDMMKSQPTAGGSSSGSTGTASGETGAGSDTGTGSSAGSGMGSSGRDTGTGSAPSGSSGTSGSSSGSTGMGGSSSGSTGTGGSTSGGDTSGGASKPDTTGGTK